MKLAGCQADQLTLSLFCGSIIPITGKRAEELKVNIPKDLLEKVEIVDQ